jgi:hypothetical protein
MHAIGRAVARATRAVSKSGSEESSSSNRMVTAAVADVSAKCTVPFYGLTGLNSGVVMVRSKLLAKSRKAQQEYVVFFVNLMNTFGASAFLLADQDALNAYAYHHPDKIAIMPCEWNVRTDSLCRNRTRTALMHGSRKAFHGAVAGMPDALRVKKGKLLQSEVVGCSRV